MDLPSLLHQQYMDSIRKLEQSANGLRDNRGKQKKEIEQRLSQQVNQLLSQIQKDMPSRTSQNFAVTTLYQEVGLRNESLANRVRGAWQDWIVEQQTRDALADQSQVWNVGDLLFSCVKPNLDLRELPLGSWSLQLEFELAKPYISHDDEPNYVIDNPVTKDRTFGLPLIRPSSWKGNLRSALRLMKKWGDESPEVTRLFGNAKGAESDFRAGRVECFPTFFYRIGLEIINPHNRARKVGVNPILFECVPAGARGTFSLLYVPFDLIGQDETEIRLQAQQDLATVCEAIQAMMLTYGFSAKRTSGYGMAKDEISGSLQTKWAGKQEFKQETFAQLIELAEGVANG